MYIERFPFKPFFRDPMLSGRKTCTARSRIMGQAGDQFHAFGVTFEIIAVKQVELSEVRNRWREEGCQSEGHFIQVWNDIHPMKKYSDDQQVYLHEFRLLQG